MTEAVIPLTQARRDDNEKAVAAYQEALPFTDAEAYLEDRGLTGETIERFRLGYVEQPAPGHGHRGWLSIPYLAHEGYPLTVRFRCIENHGHGPGAGCRDHGHGKYAGLPGEPTRLFNVSAFFDRTDEIHITEGEFDAMILSQLGLSAIACPGVQNFKIHHCRLFAGYSRIYVWGDNDEPGQKFIAEMIGKLPRARGVSVPSGDVTDTYLAGGGDAVLALIERGKK